MLPATPIAHKSPATHSAPMAQRRSVKRISVSHSRPRPLPPASSASSRRLRRAAFGLTPRYDSSTGTRSSLVKMRMHTPMLVVNASSRITAMSITISTAKPTTLVSSAVSPAKNRRRKV